MGSAASAASAAAFETDNQERIAAAFAEFDTDSSGSIDVAELSAGHSQCLLNLPFLLFQIYTRTIPLCMHASVLQRLATEGKGASNLSPTEIKSAASLVLATFDSSQNRALNLKEYVAKWEQYACVFSRPMPHIADSPSFFLRFSQATIL